MAPGSHFSSNSDFPGGPIGPPVVERLGASDLKVGLDSEPKPISPSAGDARHAQVAAHGPGHEGLESDSKHAQLDSTCAENIDLAEQCVPETPDQILPPEELYGQ